MAFAAVGIALIPLASSAQSSGLTVQAETGLETIGTIGGGKPLKKADTAPEQKAPTEITAVEETTFDEKVRVAVFTGSVVVNDPQFHLTCDKLTAYLKKGAGSGTAPTPAPKPGAKTHPKTTGKPAATPPPDSGPGGGLDHAIAEGNVIIIQDKKDENTGEVTHYTGRGAKGEFNAVTGDMRLSGWPQIQKGVNNQVATAERTIMIMNRDGHLKTIGPSKSVIVNDAPVDDKKGEKSGDNPEKVKKTGKTR